MQRLLLVIIWLLFLSLPSTTSAFWGLQTTATGTAWSNWDETEANCTEALCVELANAAAGGNEDGTSFGAVLSGASLTASQSGLLAGNANTPPFRVFDGNNDYMDAAGGTLDVIGDDSTWTMVWKVGNVTHNGRLVVDIEATTTLVWQASACGGVSAYYSDTTNGIIWNYASVTDYPTSGSTFYLFAESTGTALRMGWDDERPTNWANIDTNRKISVAVTCDPIDADTRKQIFGSDGVAPAAFSGYYFVGSQNSLLD